MMGVKPLDREQLINVRDFIMFLGEKFKISTENFEDLSKCSIQEITVLNILSRQGSTVVKDIACRLNNIKLSNLTRVLDRLEENGYVERKLNKEDRRSFIIELTEQGQRLAEAYRLKFDDMAQATLEALTPAERLILVELYTKVRTKLGDNDICLSSPLKNNVETEEELKV